MDHTEADAYGSVRIYGMTEPDNTEAIRYIGQTRQSLDERLEEHIFEATHGSNLHFRRIMWLNTVLAAGGRPGIHLLAMTDRAHANQIERQYIRSYEEQGYDLTNGTHTAWSAARHRESTRAQWQERKTGTPRIATIVTMPHTLYIQMATKALRAGCTLHSEIIAAIEAFTHDA